MDRAQQEGLCGLEGAKESCVRLFEAYFVNKDLFLQGTKFN